ncbi:MAG: hypothetical protein WCQ21_14110, partial [Verrucomicrobiota bacterium]
TWLKCLRSAHCRVLPRIATKDLGNYLDEFKPRITPLTVTTHAHTNAKAASGETISCLRANVPTACDRVNIQINSYITN